MFEHRQHHTQMKQNMTKVIGHQFETRDVLEWQEGQTPSHRHKASAVPPHGTPTAYAQRRTEHASSPQERAQPAIKSSQSCPEATLPSPRTSYTPHCARSQATEPAHAQAAGSSKGASFTSTWPASISARAHSKYQVGISPHSSDVHVQTSAVMKCMHA